MAATDHPELRDRSIGDLLKQLSDETSTLVRQEMALARAELSEQGKKAGKGAGMLGGAGLFGLGAFGTLTACLVLLLDKAMDGWLAALVVTVVWAAVAGLLALQGRNRVKEAGPPAPQTMETVKEDVQWAKTRT
ncbi:phage holin family protein [Conexibacter sp. SYSU D00693]|uniref:phage holin family protein n=1 Tax=Conexibacter sp. SYSU D00693 TaxID=2812560 RepID=UPI00196AE012|nr:phage holin family protein [Conexibacter sp. SYSU D00693]